MIATGIQEVERWCDAKDYHQLYFFKSPVQKSEQVPEPDPLPASVRSLGVAYMDEIVLQIF
ncbi:hypothetical protein M404DRAFT_1007124 [Pisolithus tinctorius Marx 270]|uniref:Uncharacterized protein n=1 Tax=Pisolithus tinctorius Marx 270 TaxID=870435 RepID=A0A0C3NJU1_PISTI|nr:hypothetical protein M404DRAFT_1007124 [Pisolithus tinctorius Marx 270]